MVATSSAAGGITNGDAGGFGGCSLRNGSGVSIIAIISNAHNKDVQKQPRRLSRGIEVNRGASVSAARARDSTRSVSSVSLAASERGVKCVPLWEVSTQDKTP